ncbi:hypothetical protein HMN09_01398800 [Mycena chlorophos]|uniref:Uncharacterized protein n=1 Tax=Mycena chlorophos TaxID=658473 RepID=A0A8H6VQJ6_MYCCL|nr:hypothetical protein HMN09_01398800 [Mycena chlorophos]
MAGTDAPPPTPPTSSPMAERTNIIAESDQAARIASLQAQVDVLKVIAASKGRRGRKRKRQPRSAPGLDATDDGDEESPPTNHRRTSSPVPEPDTDIDFYKLGRMTARHLGCAVFDDVATIITVGVKHDTALLGDEEEESIANKHILESYEIFWKQQPGLHDLLLRNHQNTDFLVALLARSVEGGIESVRSDDSSTVRSRIHNWIFDPSPPTADGDTPFVPVSAPSAGAATEKSLRGFNDAYYGALMMPLEYKDNEAYPEYALDPLLTPLTIISPVDGLRSGNYSADAKQSPCFIYPFGQKNDTSALRTALDSPIMLRCSKAIFQGPKAALEVDGFHAGRKGNAKIIGLRTFTPRVHRLCRLPSKLLPTSIALSHVGQVRFALSSQPEWNRWDGAFDYEQFFWSIVDMFTNKPNFTARTIARYNQVVFGNPNGLEIANASPANPIAAPEMSYMERMRAQALANGEDDDPL